MSRDRQALQMQDKTPERGMCLALEGAPVEANHHPGRVVAVHGLQVGHREFLHRGKQQRQREGLNQTLASPCGSATQTATGSATMACSGLGMARIRVTCRTDK